MSVENGDAFFGNVEHFTREMVKKKKFIHIKFFAVFLLDKLVNIIQMFRNTFNLSLYNELNNKIEKFQNGSSKSSMQFQPFHLEGK